VFVKTISHLCLGQAGAWATRTDTMREGTDVKGKECGTKFTAKHEQKSKDQCFLHLRIDFRLFSCDS
jgi:hypothetical protein